MRVYPVIQGLRLTYFFFSFSLSAAAVFFEPPGDDAPKEATGGASRNHSCLQQLPIPLLPANHLGLTQAERPTILVNLPPAHNAQQAFFSLQDEQNNHHYQTIVSLPAEAGIFKLKLPTTAPALEVGKNYKWSLVILCNGFLEPDSPDVTGWVRRINPTLEPTATSLETISQLAAAGIWYDTVSSLADLRQAAPTNPIVSTHWKELLVSVGLDQLAHQPLLEGE